MTYLESLIEYSKQVSKKEIIACQKHRWACERFLGDIDCWQNDPSFEYEFIEERALRFPKWAALFKHRKGVLSGESIEFAPIVHFISANIYGWYHKDTGYRRFSKMYWQVARKNMKSQLLSLMGSFELLVFSGSDVAEVYSAATKKDQSKIIYDETVAMVEGCKALKKGTHYTVTNGRLTRLSNGGFMRALSKEDKKSGDGYNPQCGLIDEYHAHETSEVYDIIDSGMVARPQPLLAIITTAGFELNNPCYRVEYDLVSKILDPSIPTDIDSYFVMINELESNTTDEDIDLNGKKIKPGELIDDINNPDIWEKANPIVCSYPEGVDGIKKRLALALEAPEKMRDFMTKTMNVWVNERSFGYMNMVKWGLCATEDQSINELIIKNTSKTCFVGLDLSAKLDLTSADFEFPGIDGKYYLKSHSFMPREKFTEKMKTDKVPYDLWEKQGWLTVTEGAVVDYRAVKKYVLDEVKKNSWFIEEVCIDPWGATQLASDFDDEGILVVEVVQGYKTLSEPTKDFRNMVYSGRVVHEGNPILAWSMGNAVTRLDYNKNMTLDKSKAKQRIDPSAAVMNSHVRAMTYRVESSNKVFFV